jgi:hypothetical protein
MSKGRAIVRGGVPVVGALFIMAGAIPLAWANPPAPHPGPPPPPHVRAADCTKQHGRIVADPGNPKSHHCEGGPLNGRGIQ